jgi:hypothetical protein
MQDKVGEDFDGDQRRHELGIFTRLDGRSRRPRARDRAAEDYFRCHPSTTR